MSQQSTVPIIQKKKAKPRGGSRKGRPNKSTNEVKSILDANVNFNVVAKKLYELVKGVSVQTVKRGKTVIYVQPPDTAAAKVLFEFRFGKPHQQIGIQGELDHNHFSGLEDADVHSLAVMYAKQKIKEKKS
jgi:hypothetical protein